MQYIFGTLIFCWIFGKTWDYFQRKRDLKKHEMSKQQKDFFKGEKKVDYRGRIIEMNDPFYDLVNDEHNN